MLLLIFEDYWNEEYHMCHIEEFMCITKDFITLVHLIFRHLRFLFGWNCVWDVMINLSDFMIIKNLWSYIAYNYLLICLFVCLSNTFS